MAVVGSINLDSGGFRLAPVEGRNRLDRSCGRTAGQSGSCNCAAGRLPVCRASVLVPVVSLFLPHHKSIISNLLPFVTTHSLSSIRLNCQSLSTNNKQFRLAACDCSPLKCSIGTGTGTGTSSFQPAALPTRRHIDAAQQPQLMQSTTCRLTDCTTP